MLGIVGGAFDIIMKILIFNLRDMEQKNIIHILHYLQSFNFKDCQTLITDRIKNSNIDLIRVEKDYMLRSLFNTVDSLLTLKED